MWPIFNHNNNFGVCPMLKKVLITGAALALSSSLSFANGIPYIGASIGEVTNARLGVVRSRFTPSSSTNRNVNGGQLGLGMQVGLTQNVDLRGEYVFTAYQSFSGISTPRQDQFNLGLVYKFD